MDTKQNSGNNGPQQCKPLVVVPWSTGYGCDIMCGDLVIGSINENFRNQFRAEFNEAFTQHKGWKNTHNYFHDETAAMDWIRNQWAAFLRIIFEPMPMYLPTPESMTMQLATAMNVPPEQIRKDIDNAHFDQ